MSEAPQISVVMAVRDGEAQLGETLASVLSQTGPAFELIVVDDGSRDATAARLGAAAVQEPRLRVLRQDRLGLTRALIAGCAAARAPFIARQDNGDISLPGRFAHQFSRLAARSGAVLHAVGTEFIGPGGEQVQSADDNDASLTAGLATTDIRHTRGPSHHGACMFSRAAYEATGGYRAAFPVAQDLDLWMRLVERGACLADREPLYRARLEAGGVSAIRRAEQAAYRRVVIAGARERRRGRSDPSDLMALALAASPPKPDSPAAFPYFLARRLETSRPDAARAYLAATLRAKPLHPGAWLALARLTARRWLTAKPTEART